MAIVFKYKNPTSREYAPGFVDMGIQGQQGKQGTHGNSLFLLDYELNNSYNVELTLQKIDKNLSLSSNDSSINELLSSRPYKEGDILITSNKVCYKLIHSNENSLFNNYKFDVKRLGQLRNSYKSNIKTLKIFDFSGTRLVDETGKLIKSYDTTIKSCYPNHKDMSISMNTDFYDGIHNECFNTFGVWLKFICVTDKSQNKNTSLASKLNDYKYSLEMNLYNEKLIDNNSRPENIYENDPSDANLSNEDLSKYKIQFYKKLEIPNLSSISNKTTVNDNEYTDNLNELLFGDCFDNLVPKGDDVYINNTPKCSTLFLDDFGLDVIHPSNNNIKCTLDEPKWMWLGQKASNYNDPFNDLFYNIESKTIIDENDKDVNVSYKIMKSFISEIQGPNAGNDYLENKTILTFPYKSKTKDKNNNLIDFSIESKDDLGQKKWISILDDNDIHCMGGFLKTSSLDNIQTGIDNSYNINDKNTYESPLQFPIYDLWNKNLTHKKDKDDVNLASFNVFGGNSLYFSSMNDYDTFHGNMIKYIDNSKNVFNIYMTSSATKETTMVNVNYDIDTTYAFKEIKLYKGSDKKIHIEIVKDLS